VYFFPGQQSSGTVLDLLAANQGLIGPIVLVAVLAVITVFRATLTDVQVAIILTSLIVMTSSTSWYYYAIFAIPALLAVTQMKHVRKGIIASADSELTPTEKKINFILWSALVLTLIQLPMYELASNTLIIVTTANLIGGFWIGAYILIFAALLKERSRNKIKAKPQNSVA
jgi:hypothetical protein